MIPVLCYAQELVISPASVSSKLPDLEDAILFKLEENLLSEVVEKNYKEIRLSIPVSKDVSLQVVLSERNIFSDDFAVLERGEQGKDSESDYTRGKYFGGKVSGEENSQVTLSIYKNKIAGIVRSDDKVYNIGVYHNSTYHIVYEVKNLKEEIPFHCESIDLHDPKLRLPYTALKTTSTCNNAVEIYIECDYHMYQNLNSNVTTVTDYVTDMMNEVYTLYNNANIPISISQIVVWTTDDNYSDNSSGLYDFKDDLIANGYNGDVGLLLTNDPGNNGGIAYVDQLCGSFPFAYADIVNSYSLYPTYSWDVQVTTHEIGHVLGSRHTHECVWGPNNDEQIDDCGSLASGGGGSCYNPSNPIIPSAGGTIMSYCHTQQAGISFTQGFGSQPGNLIRQKHSSCKCDNATCADATEIIESGTNYAHPNNGNGATMNNASHADWFVFEPDTNGVVTIRSCGEGVDTRIWIYSGSCSNLVYENYSDDDCNVGNGGNYASEIIEQNVSAGQTYYIEWDSRWSTSDFNWEFIYVADTSSTTVEISCPDNVVDSNHCTASDYDPSSTGSATSTTSGAAISYADDISTTLCDVLIDRVWTATDSGGNTSSCSQSIELSDVDAPVITYCPDDITVDSDNNCTAQINWNPPYGTDNCDNNLALNSTHTPNSVFPIGITTVTYTISDNCNNSASCNFDINVIDVCTIDITCPNDYIGSRTCDPNIDGHVTITNEAISTVSNAQITYTDVITTTDCEVDIQRTWVATSTAGNTMSCNQLIELGDAEGPQIFTCPNDTVVGSDMNCVFVYDFELPSATDNCTSNTIVSVNYFPGSTFTIGETDVIYVFEDDCGNQSECSFKVEVYDQCTPCDGDVLNIDGMISDSSYHAQTQLNSGGMLMTGENSIFNAGETIELKAGFEVQAGAVFEATIDDCINN